MNHKQTGATQKNPKQETAVNDGDIRSLEEKFRFNAISIDTVTQNNLQLESELKKLQKEINSRQGKVKDLKSKHSKKLKKPCDHANLIDTLQTRLNSKELEYKNIRDDLFTQLKVKEAELTKLIGQARSLRDQA